PLRIDALDTSLGAAYLKSRGSSPKFPVFPLSRSIKVLETEKSDLVLKSLYIGDGFVRFASYLTPTLSALEVITPDAIASVIWACALGTGLLTRVATRSLREFANFLSLAGSPPKRPSAGTKTGSFISIISEASLSSFNISVYTFSCEANFGLINWFTLSAWKSGSLFP